MRMGSTSKNFLKLRKNLFEIREIKNFKTTKFKQRTKKHQQRLPLRSSFKYNHRHHDDDDGGPPSIQATSLFKNNCCLRISQIIMELPLPSLMAASAASASAVAAVVFTVVTHVASALQLLLNAAHLKMSLIIVLLLSIVASDHHLADCQEILERDNSNLFYSQNNNFSENILQYVVRSKQNVINKRLIDDKQSTINSNIINTSHNPRRKLRTARTSTSKSMARVTDTSSSTHQEGSYFFYKNNNSNNNNENISPKTYGNQSIRTMNFLSNFTMEADENQQLLQIVMEGLGLKKLPDFNKANISQLEYATKYNEYLDRVRERYIEELPEFDNDVDDDEYENLNNTLSLLSIAHNFSDTKLYRKRRSPNKDKTSSTRSVLLRFPLDIKSELQPSDIEEANIRLLLITSPELAASEQNKRKHRNRQNRNGGKKIQFDIDQKNNNNTTGALGTTPSENKQKKGSKHSGKPVSHVLNMKVYQLLKPKGKLWIDEQKIEIKIDRSKMDETISRWIEFDVTKAVEGWLIEKKVNLGLEIQCDNCFRNGARIIDDLSGGDSEEDTNTTNKYDLAPVLNIIGRLGTHREKRSKHYHNQMTEKPQRKLRKNNCYKDNQRCCRHSMEVVFKEIKGFEFIIQPKVFDAGYCRGRCPPRYNPAHHHALLQSLIWKQDRKKVPRPCCAPSKLIALEVLHVDEKDSEKLKISTWTDMRVLECACS